MERRARLQARYVVALRGCRVRRPCGDLPSVALRLVRCAPLRIELLLTRGIAWRARRKGLVGIGAALRAGRDILRTGERIVASSVAVLDRTVAS